MLRRQTKMNTVWIHINNTSSEKKLTHTREKKGGVILFFFAFFSKMTFCVTYFIHSSIYHEEKKKMTINDHDQFTGLNAVHVAASEGDVKRLVELMDEGAELDVPALGGTISRFSSLYYSF